MRLMTNAPATQERPESSADTREVGSGQQIEGAEASDIGLHDEGHL